MGKAPGRASEDTSLPKPGWYYSLKNDIASLMCVLLQWLTFSSIVHTLSNKSKAATKKVTERLIIGVA